jgi:Ca2+-binding RTX toxin-like protein
VTGSLFRSLAVVGVLAVGASLVVSLTAANGVPATNVGQIQLPIGANELKPAACAGINLTTVVAGTTGTGGNDLLLGTTAANVMTGGGGVDCILGGDGNDAITGNGPVGGDVCIGGAGLDVFVACTTQIQ